MGVSLNTFVEAARRGDLRKVKEFINLDRDVNQLDQYGVTALHAAADRGQDNIVKLLIHSNASVCVQDKLGRTALHFAVSWGRGTIAQRLVDNNAPVNVQDKHGWTLLHSAAMGGHDNIVQLLIDNSASVGVQNNKGFTALHWAANNGHDKTAQLLVGNNCLVDVQDEDGDTPLHRAARGGYSASVNIVQVLIDNNASVNTKNASGQTPLHRVADMIGDKCGEVSIMKLLLSANAELNSVDNDGWIPLHYACTYEYQQQKCKMVVEFLLNSKATLDAQTTKRGDMYSVKGTVPAGSTALHVSCQTGSIAVASLLIESRANVELKNEEGVTALQKQAKREQEEQEKAEFLKQEEEERIANEEKELVQNEEEARLKKEAELRLKKKEKVRLKKEDEGISRKQQEKLRQEEEDRPKREREAEQLSHQIKPEDWTSTEVCEWLRSVAPVLKKYETKFLEFGIDGETLFSMNELEIGTIVKESFLQKKIWRNLMKLKSPADAASKKLPQNDSESYEAKNKDKRGLALVIGNGNSGDVQISCHKDANKINETLSAAGYEVHHFEDLSDASIMAHALELSMKSHTEFDSFVIYFSGHGGNGIIYGHDVDVCNELPEGGVEINRITDFYQAKHCRSLKGKPKIFLWDCCRGVVVDKSKGWESMSSKHEFTAPKFRDFLYGYASAVSYVSYPGGEDTDGLSVWTYFLVKRLEMNAGKRHFSDLLVRVQRDFADYVDEVEGKKQAANHVSFLQKDFHLM